MKNKENKPITSANQLGRKSNQGEEYHEAGARARNRTMIITAAEAIAGGTEAAAAGYSSCPAVGCWGTGEGGERGEGAAADKTMRDKDN